MSGQCLSASGAGRALTPARHLRLGGPLPRQQPNITWAPPRAINLCCHQVIRYYPPSRTAIPNPGVGTHALLPLTPVPPLLGFPRLACLIHAANVRSEPGSNPSKCIVTPQPGCALRGSIRHRCSVELKEPADLLRGPHLKVHEFPVQQRQTHDPLRLSTHSHPSCQRSTSLTRSDHGHPGWRAAMGFAIRRFRESQRKLPAMTYFRAGRTIIGPKCLTAVFGMGTGVATWVWSPAVSFGRRIEIQPAVCFTIR